MNDFAMAAREACAAEVTFDEFARKSDGWWSRRAAGLARRYKLPGFYDAADIKQDLLIAAWGHTKSYDPGKGTSAGSYLDFCSRKTVQKKISRVQGVEQHRRKGPVQFEIPFSSMQQTNAQKESGATWDETAAQCEATQHKGIEEREHLEILLSLCTTEVERLAVRAVLVGKSLDVAAALLYREPDARLTCRLGNETQARSLVRGVVEGLIGRFGKEEA